MSDVRERTTAEEIILGICVWVPVALLGIYLAERLPIVLAGLGTGSLDARWATVVAAGIGAGGAVAGTALAFLLTQRQERRRWERENALRHLGDLKRACVGLLHQGALLSSRVRLREGPWAGQQALSEAYAEVTLLAPALQGAATEVLRAAIMYSHELLGAQQRGESLAEERDQNLQASLARSLARFRVASRLEIGVYGAVAAEGVGDAGVGDGDADAPRGER